MLCYALLCSAVVRCGTLWLWRLLAAGDLEISIGRARALRCPLASGSKAVEQANCKPL